MDRIKKEVDKMTRMPVSPAFSGNNGCRSVNYTGRKEGENEVATADAKSSSNLAKVPVVVMIAMSPAMLNGKVPPELMNDMNGAKTEMVALPTNTADAEVIPNLFEAEKVAPVAPQQRANAPFGESNLRGKVIQYSKSFNRNGSKYNFVFVSEKGDGNLVRYVYVFPQGYNSSAAKLLPQVTNFVYHDIGKGKEFGGVIVYSIARNAKGEYKQYKEEIRLPDELAQSIIDLLAKDSQFRNGTAIKYSETRSRVLLNKMEVK